MIRSMDQMLYRLDNLNTENERISYQMSTGKKLQYGSDDTKTYTRELYIDDKIRVYEGIKRQIDTTTAQNNSADLALADAKDFVSHTKTEILKALNATTTDTAKEAIAINLEGVKDSLLSIANESVEGEYLFAGSDSSITPFEKDASGKVTYVGDAQLRKIAVEHGSYRERGVNGFETFFYTADSALKNETLTFSVDDRILDQDGSEWKPSASSSVTAGVTLNFNPTDAIVDQEGTVWTLNSANTALKDGKGNTISVSLAASPPNPAGSYDVVVPADQPAPAAPSTLGVVDQVTEYDNKGNVTGDTLAVSGSAPDSLTLTTPNVDGTNFEAKSNIFDLLDDIINALNEVDDEGNTVSDAVAKTVLENSSEELTKAYDAMNIGHARLGGRNRIFEVASETISSKVFQYERLKQEVSGVDLAKVAAEAKSLELTYTALYSTINRMNELSLVNFIR